MEQAIGDINLEMLKELSEAHGISGNEKEVSRMMKKWMNPYADEITYDNLGSIIGLQKGEEDQPTLMICGQPACCRRRSEPPWLPVRRTPAKTSGGRSFSS